MTGKVESCKHYKYKPLSLFIYLKFVTNIYANIMDIVYFYRWCLLLLIILILKQRRAYFPRQDTDKDWLPLINLSRGSIMETFYLQFCR